MAITMLAEEKKLISIPKAIGLFMIFKALFYREHLVHYQATTSLERYSLLIHNINFYLFLALGIMLCFHYSKKIIHSVAILFSINLFGAVYIVTAIQSSLFKSVVILSAHVCILFILYWSSSRIDKIRTF
jgi:hypothetical protein